MPNASRANVTITTIAIATLATVWTRRRRRLFVGGVAGAGTVVSSAAAAAGSGGIVPRGSGSVGTVVGVAVGIAVGAATTNGAAPGEIRIVALPAWIASPPATVGSPRRNAVRSWTMAAADW